MDDDYTSSDDGSGYYYYDDGDDFFDGYGDDGSHDKLTKESNSNTNLRNKNRKMKYTNTGSSSGSSGGSGGSSSSGGNKKLKYSYRNSKVQSDYSQFFTQQYQPKQQQNHLKPVQHTSNNNNMIDKSHHNHQHQYQYDKKLSYLNHLKSNVFTYMRAGTILTHMQFFMNYLLSVLLLEN